MVKKRRLSDKKEDQLQYEKLRDTQNRFVAERYDSDGFYYHFHRNPELYCVIRGEVTVTVDGDSRVLTEPAPEVVVSAYQASSVEYTLRVWTTNAEYWNVYFALNENCRTELEKNGLSMAFDRLDVRIIEDK